MTQSENTRQPRNDYKLGYAKGAEWMKQRMIEKIVKYLESHSLPSENGHYFSVSDIGIDKLKQAMKGE